MTSTQSLLRDAAAKLCRASAWLDPRRSDATDATEEALKFMSDARLIVESVEMTVGREAATHEEMLSTPESIT